MEIKFNLPYVSLINATKEDVINFVKFISETENEVKLIKTVSPEVDIVTETVSETVTETEPEVGRVTLDEFVGRVTLDETEPEVGRVTLDEEAETETISVKELSELLHTSNQLVYKRLTDSGLPIVSYGYRKVKLYNRADALDYFKRKPIKVIASKGKGKVTKAKAEKSDFAKWNSVNRLKCQSVGRDIGKTYSLVFKEMTKVYGISFDQLKKEFYRFHGYSAKSTIQLVYFLEFEQEHNANEHYENLFENLLDRILSENEVTV